MPQLLLELFSEEIPARMQKRAEEDLARLIGEKLKASGIDAKAIKTFCAPRRLGLFIDDLPAKAADVNEEKKGPRVGAPDQAIQGFLKSAGLASIDQAQVVEDKKGAFYVARIERAGRAVPEIVGEILPEIVRAFPWPKSMRSGSSDLQWVRPLHNICCVFDGKPVRVEIDGIGNEPVTWGHRFHAPEALPVASAADHASKLRGAKVLIEREERKAIILDHARKLCAAKGLELVEDAGLLEEVAGLVEWPVVLLGDMDAAFLDLPAEVIRLSMRTHQKYFAVREKGGAKLAPHFIVVANVDAKDGGKAIAAGNARVLSARLNDARFFWDTDRKTPLYTEERREKLKKIVFHQKLGSVWDKVERVKALARELAPVVWESRQTLTLRQAQGDAEVGRRPSELVEDDASAFATLDDFIGAVECAAELCKMDLVTETVGEFPELQGQVGRQLYALEISAEPSPPSRGRGQGEGGRSASQAPERLNAPHPPAPAPRGGGGDASVAQAIEDHYRPLGPNDRVPTDPVALTLALADKLDTLAAFWLVDERPTGSSDPYALRRAALGVVRILKEQKVESAADESNVLGGLLLTMVQQSIARRRRLAEADKDAAKELLRRLRLEAVESGLDYQYVRQQASKDGQQELLRDFETGSAAWASLRDFVLDRVEVALRDSGIDAGIVRAGSRAWAVYDGVLGNWPSQFVPDSKLTRVFARVEALDAFLKTQDGANLLAGYKRAANILAAEEKKGKGLSDADIAAGLDAKALVEPAEKALHAALESAVPTARSAVEAEDFAAAMKALSALRAPVDAFFEGVLVNAEDPILRRNRLLLLSRLREALSEVADFSKIEG